VAVTRRWWWWQCSAWKTRF